MVNKTKTVGALVALTIAMVVMLSLAILPAMANGNETTLPVVAEANLSMMADGNETMVTGNDTALVLLAGEIASPVMINATLSSHDDPDDASGPESGNITFPAENNYLFSGERYIFTWTCGWLPNYISVGIMPIEADGAGITWLCIMQDWPCDNRLEFYAPILDTGAYKMVVVLDHDGEQEDIFGDAFWLINESVYVPPSPPASSMP